MNTTCSLVGLLISTSSINSLKLGNYDTNLIIVLYDPFIINAERFLMKEWKSKQEGDKLDTVQGLLISCMEAMMEQQASR